jgi:hypothetical protein
VRHTSLKRRAAAGIDQVTWDRYAENLEENLRGPSPPSPDRSVSSVADASDLHSEGGWQATAARIAAIEDKSVQAAVVMILTPIYEAEFLGFSYGFRPERASMVRWTRSRTGSKDAMSGGFSTPISGRSSTRSIIQGWSASSNIGSVTRGSSA